MNRSAVLATLAIATLALAGCTRHREPGVLAAAEPEQGAPDRKAFTWKGYLVNPLASFRITARVLHTADYWMDREAKVAPRDLALGWGPMSDSAVLGEYRIGQMARFYHWSSRTMPIPPEEVIAHSANMHIIPADDAVKRELGRVREGDVVTIDGELVEVVADDGWEWASSTTRDDSGDGACELVFARSIEVR